MHTFTFSTSQKGLSLIEVLIAVTVLGIGLISVVQLQGTVIKDGAFARTRTEASNLALDRIEKFRNFPATVALSNITSGHDNVQGNTHHFHRSWQVTPMHNGQMRVGLDVSWPDDKGTHTDATTVSFTTFLSSFVPAVSSVKHQSSPSISLIQHTDCAKGPKTIMISTPNKVEVCHIPPGNPSNKHTISISLSAVETHIAKHGDFIGRCPDTLSVTTVSDTSSTSLCL